MGGKKTSKTPCSSCPLRDREAFRRFAEGELDFVKSFKVGELAVEPGATIFVEGANSAHLFTVLTGWGFRHKSLEDGRRQILNYVMPGDLIGLQGTLLGEMQHSVEALSRMTLCMFERERMMDLFQRHPSLGFDLTWIAAREERVLDENLLSLGRRTALERAAYLLALIQQKAISTGLSATVKARIPITQQHVADTLGLSMVHTNKTLRKLVSRGFIRWLDRGCEIINIDGLLELAQWDGYSEPSRPFL